MDYQFQVINTMYNRGLETIKRTKDKDKLKDLKEANVLFKNGYIYIYIYIYIKKNINIYLWMLLTKWKYLIIL